MGDGLRRAGRDGLEGRTARRLDDGADDVAAVHGKYVHSTQYLVLGTWYLVLGTWYLVLGTWYLVLDT